MIDRRQFLSTAAMTASGTCLASRAGASAENAMPKAAKVTEQNKGPNCTYERELDRIAFPLGGMGAGMICLGGTGALSQFSLRHRPTLSKEPTAFAAISIKGLQGIARVLEGPVPRWKLSQLKYQGDMDNVPTASWGLPRFGKASFNARFPFAEVALRDDRMPLDVKISGWSPFEPGDADNASLPVAGLEYQFTNRTTTSIEAVFSFNALNFMTVPSERQPFKESSAAICPTPGGFMLYGEGAPRRPWDSGTFAAWLNDSAVRVNYAWFRGGLFEPVTSAWRDVERGACYAKPPITEGPSPPGASLFLPLSLGPGTQKTIALHLAWYVGKSNLLLAGGSDDDRVVMDGSEAEKNTYKPWYAGRFADIAEVVAYWSDHYDDLRTRSRRFSECFYSSTLPPEVMEAVTANLTILKSPTILRQTDGRIWGWEGSDDGEGAGPGSCTHVWNYAQAIPHLFPALERTLRETEFLVCQNDTGHQVYRAPLPIRSEDQDHHSVPAADGQLGGVMKVYRDWRISGDTQWMKEIWPKVRCSLDYCIRTWDPRHSGWLEEPQHVTYDMPLWGPNGMCTSVYLGALKAATLMGMSLGDDVSGYADLFARGARKIEDLFDGEYFIQRVDWRNLKARYPEDAGEDLLALSPPQMPEAVALADKEGPKYQYGKGCLSDGVVGAWFALVCGVGDVLEGDKIKSHLQSVYRFNLKNNLSNHAIIPRAILGCGEEGGLLVCTWPKGGEPSVPLLYSREVWTGVEYQVASHLIAVGLVDEGLDIVRTCRNRYDGSQRNPFAEIEAGCWYVRAMSSYALLQAVSGARYDAVDKVLHLKPGIRGDFRSFMSTATGYGIVGVRNGIPFVEIVSGTIPYVNIMYTASN